MASKSGRAPFVVVANTLPVRRRRARSGKPLGWETSPGGLVSALAPVVREAAGAWVGWIGGSSRPPKPFQHEGIRQIPVPVNAAEVDGYYEGVCNRTLWPLYHDAVRQPEYHRHWWREYLAVNQRFAEYAGRAARRGATVWVQDYHLQLVPRMLRSRRPDLRIGFFLHIPFPPEELFLRLPWRRQILDGVLGADVVGFQSKRDAANFLNLGQDHAGLQRSGATLDDEGRQVQVGAFPISIDFERFDRQARKPETLERAQELRERLGQGRRVLLGVDRLDYTKGIDLRMKSFAEWLASSSGGIREAVLVQVAVPSRERIQEYQQTREQVESLVGQINGEYGEVGIAAVHYLRRNLPFEELVALYRAADVMLVTPLADGMNLVAKEYVATRFDDSGTLVLSEFTGSATELKAAVTVNPHDVDGMTEAIDRSLAMAEDERTRRMRRLRRIVSRNTVHHWAQSFLEALRG